MLDTAYAERQSDNLVEAAKSIAREKTLTTVIKLKLPPNNPRICHLLLAALSLMNLASWPNHCLAPKRTNMPRNGFN